MPNSTNPVYETMMARFADAYMRHYREMSWIIIFQFIVESSSSGNQCEIALTWMPQNLTNEKSTLVHVMAWYCQATSHYPSQYWPRYMLSHGVTRPQPKSRQISLDLAGNSKLRHFPADPWRNDNAIIASCARWGRTCLNRTRWPSTSGAMVNFLSNTRD